VRAVRREPVSLAVDDVRTYCGYRVVVEAEARERCRSQVGDEGVARGGDAQQRVFAVGVFEVERDVALVAQQVQGDVGELAVRAGSHAPVDVAAGGFDGQDVGAEVAEDLGGERPHHDRGEVQHAHAVERPWAHGVEVLPTAGCRR
jgi:hypothetical protein